MSGSAMPQVGDVAPAFDLPAFPEGRVQLKQFKGRKNVVLYFYPRDNTPGCTTEACDFRDRLATFDSAETVVLGISTDSPKSHEKFSEKHSLPFPLLSDEGAEQVERILTVNPPGQEFNIYRRLKNNIYF